MKRLIDGELLKQNCRCTGTPEDEDEYINRAMLSRVIDNQPIAFDIDALFKEMWRESEDVCGNTMIDLEVAQDLIQRYLTNDYCTTELKERSSYAR